MNLEECKNPEMCRGGCCRSFLGKQFCEMESDCVHNPTWIIALVPAALGLAAIILIAIVLIRINRRKVIAHYQHIKMKAQSSNALKSQSQRQMLHKKY